MSWRPESHLQYNKMELQYVKNTTENIIFQLTNNRATTPCHFIQIKTKNSEKNKSSHATRRILFGLQSCVDFICLCLDSHTRLFEAARWQSLSRSASKTRQTVYYQWNTLHVKSITRQHYALLSCDEELIDQLVLIISGHYFIIIQS